MRTRTATATKPEKWEFQHRPSPEWDTEHPGTCALRGVHGAWVPWPCPEAAGE